MATIERRQQQGDAPPRWRVRRRDGEDRQRSRTFTREGDARRYKAQLDVARSYARRPAGGVGLVVP